MSTNPRKYLDEARSAFKSKDYARALTNYEYFFDHALDDDGASFYGVRLSYCLDEWVQLGEEYPLAKERLIQRRDESLKRLYQTSDRELFHDYVAICEYLNCSHLSIEAFENIHKENETLANEVVSYIWDDLVSNGLWDICLKYLPDPDLEYQRSITNHDLLVKMLKDKPDMGGEGYEQQMNSWVVRDISNILLVLKNNGRMELFTNILNTAKCDLRERGQDDLFLRIREKAGI